MNSDSLFTRGRPAWSPSARATHLDVWHEHEIPFIGTFEMGTSRILFTVVGNIDSSMRTGVWAYKALREEAPTSFVDVGQMRQWVEARFENSEACFAITHDLHLIRYSDLLRVDSIYDGASAFLEGILEATDDPRTRARARFGANQAEVETIERDLVDA